MGDVIALRPAGVRPTCIVCRRTDRTVASLASNMHICRQCCFDAIEAMDEADPPTEIKYPDGHGWSFVDGEWAPY